MQLRILVVLAAAAWGLATASAATRTWSGLSTIDNLWSDTANWTGSARPAAGDDVYYPGSPRAVSQNDLLGSLRSITFGVSGYEIVGNSLILTNGITATNATGGNVLVNTIALGANQSFTNVHAGATLELVVLDLNGRALTLGGAGTNILDVLQASVAGGSLTNDGTGVLLFIGTNSNFTGPMALNGGTNLFTGFQQRSPITWTAGTLGGTGHVGTITASGLSAKQLAPGYLGAGGGLWVSNLVLNSAVTMDVQISGTNIFTDYGRTLVNGGNANLGSATLSVTFATNFSPLVGTQFFLFLTDPSSLVSGTFANLPEGATLTNNGIVCAISYNFGHGVVLTVTNVPSTGVTRQWTGGGANNLWSNPTNWSGNVAPQQGDALFFVRGASQIINSNDFPPQMTFDSIHFETPQATSASWTLLGNPLRLNAGVRLEPTPANAATGAGTYTISNSLALNGAQSFTNALPANLHLAGGIELGPNLLSVGVLGVTGGGMFFDGPLTGAGIFERNGGNGLVTLNASNAVSGSIQVNHGTLSVQHPQGLGSASSGPVQVSTNGVLSLLSPNTVYTGSSVALAGALEVPSDNFTLAAALVEAGSNAVVVVSNSSFFGTASLTLPGPVTNTGQLTFAGAGVSGTILRMPAGALVEGGGTLRNLNLWLIADASIHNTVQLGDGARYGSLSSAGQIDVLISTNRGGTISPGSALDTNLAYSPLQVGMLVMEGTNTTLAISLFPNRPGGGPTNTAIIATNPPILGNASLTVTAQTNLAPNQQFTIIRNLSSSPTTNTFNNLPEGAFVAPGGGNFGLQISYVGGGGHDVVLTVQSNTPPFFAIPSNTVVFMELSNNFYTNVIFDIENNSPFTWTLLTPISGLALNPTNGVLTWTPQEGQACSNYTVLCKVTDSGIPSASSTGTVFITVQEINQPPVTVPVPPTNVLAGNTLTIQLQASDPDFPPQPLTWSAVSLPTNASVTPSGLFTLSTGPFTFGTNTMRVKVSDSDPCAVNSTSLSSNLTFTVAILRRRIVTNTNNFGDGSLSNAIVEIGTNSSGGHIEFNIPGPGPFKIAPVTPLPALSQNTYLDGYSQPGSQPNTNTIGTTAKILIELSGENQSTGNALVAGQSGTTIRGLCVNRFTNGNYAINSSVCCGSGEFCEISGVAIEGCFVGTDISGSNAFPNSLGISFGCTHSSRLGGPDPAQRNLISGNLQNAVDIGGDEFNFIVQNNLIGTDATGTNPIPNGAIGLSLSTIGNPGYSCTVADNVISGNAQGGISSGAPGLLIVRNKIGVGADGVTPLANVSSGILLGNASLLVGGTNTADANMIAYNHGPGVDIFGANITVEGNSIFRNTGRGIKLESNANNNQSAPALTSVTATSGSVTINGTLTSSNAIYRIEFFHNPDFAPSNAPQAWIFLGATNVTTDSSSNASFAVTFNQTVSGGFVTATATDPNGNTSGISDGVAVVVVRDFGVDVSHFQGSNGVAQTAWNQMLTEGKHFTYIKATEGLTGPDDPTMQTNVMRAAAAGLLVGVYHFAHPENRPTTNGAIQEADHLLSCASNYIGPGYLRPALDIEGSAGSLSIGGLTDWIIAFSEHIKQQRGAGAAPVVYMDSSFANNHVDSRLAGYDLWLAYYTNVDVTTAQPPPSALFPNPTGVFTNWSLWQYSDTGTAGGISPIDLDVSHSEYKPLTGYVIPTPLPMFTITGLSLSGGGFQFGFTNIPGTHFTVLATTNLTLFLSNWTVLTAVTEISPGQFEFTDASATNSPQRFYRVRSP